MGNVETFLHEIKKVQDLFTNEIDQIAAIQRYFAHIFAFENLDVLLGNEEPITEPFLLDKMVQQKRGGLCYELNGLMHLVLRELGYPVTLSAATVWSDNGWIMDKTHTINLYQKKNHLYLIDSGSGNNLTLQPLQLGGSEVTSPAGTFRLRRRETERGSIVSEKLSTDGWTLRYAFYPVSVGWDDLTRIKYLIHHHPDSPFNKKLLFAKTMEDGTMSITNDRYRYNKKGKTETITFNDNAELLTMLKKFANKSVYDTANNYVTNGR